MLLPVCPPQVDASYSPVPPTNPTVISLKLDVITDFIEAVNSVVADLYRENKKMQNFRQNAFPKPKFISKKRSVL